MHDLVKKIAALGFLGLVLGLLSPAPAQAQMTNPFVREQSGLLQQMQQQQAERELEQEMAAEQAAEVKPTAANPSFNVTPEMLQMLRPQEEDQDYSTIFVDMNVVAMSGKKALLKSTDYLYYVKGGGSFSHQGQQFFVEIDEGIVTVLSAQGTRVYVGSVGSGLEIEQTVESTSNQSNNRSNNNQN